VCEKSVLPRARGCAQRPPNTLRNLRGVQLQFEPFDLWGAQPHRNLSATCEGGPRFNKLSNASRPRGACAKEPLAHRVQAKPRWVRVQDATQSVCKRASFKGRASALSAPHTPSATCEGKPRFNQLSNASLPRGACAKEPRAHRVQAQLRWVRVQDERRRVCKKGSFKGRASALSAPHTPSATCEGNRPLIAWYPCT
jgi:hypothetical protein